MSDTRSLSGRSAVNWRFTSLVGQDRRASGFIVTAVLSRPTPSIPMLRIYRRAVPEKCFHDKGLMSKWIDGNRREREHATEQFSCVADQSLRHEARILPTQNSDRGNDRVVRRAVPNQVP